MTLQLYHSQSKVTGSFKASKVLKMVARDRGTWFVKGPAPPDKARIDL